MNENRCISCSEIVPEGRMICPSCERREIKIGMIMQSYGVCSEKVDRAYNSLGENNDD